MAHLERSRRQRVTSFPIQTLRPKHFHRTRANSLQLVPEVNVFTCSKISLVGQQELIMSVLFQKSILM